METSEKIKRGLECVCCGECPWLSEDGCMWSDDFVVALIQQLEQDNAQKDERIRQLEQLVPRWTSVKERLPEDDDHYLVWSSYNGCAEVAMYWGDGEWLTDDIVNITRMVTHWMPLPEPPEEDA